MQISANQTVLVQITPEGDGVPIAFMSQKLNAAQRNYTVTEQECLATVQANMKFRVYVKRHKYEVITDHPSLKRLMNQNDSSGCLAQWLLKLQGFKFTIEHRKRTQNIIPDTLP